MSRESEQSMRAWESRRSDERAAMLKSGGDTQQMCSICRGTLPEVANLHICKGFEVIEVPVPRRVDG